MTVLIFHTTTEIKFSLFDVAIDDAERFITNGYPDQLADWQAGTLTATVLEPAEGYDFSPGDYEIVDGEIVKKPQPEATP